MDGPHKIAFHPLLTKSVYVVRLRTVADGLLTHDWSRLIVVITTFPRVILELPPLHKNFKVSVMLDSFVKVIVIVTYCNIYKRYGGHHYTVNFFKISKFFSSQYLFPYHEKQVESQNDR